MDWTTILLTALLSSLSTLLIGGVVLKWWVLPELERHMDRKTDEAARRLEQQLRQRIAQGFAETLDPLRELLVARAGMVARSTADIVGDGVRRVLDRLGPRTPADRDDA